MGIKYKLVREKAVMCKTWKIPKSFMLSIFHVHFSNHSQLHSFISKSNA